jgi:hypothetical protein
MGANAIVFSFGILKTNQGRTTGPLANFAGAIRNELPYI